jgi:dipeptidyl aminopeptidase/acylaminoacyl peptidase
MIDERQVFERVMRGFVPPDDSLERLVRRRDRKRRNQRIAAGVVGIAVFVAAVWAVTTGGSFNRTQQPAMQPTPTPPAGTAPETAYLIDLNTGEMTPLPKSIAGNFGYAVSPDGTMVAYSSPDDAGTAQVFIASLDGTDVQQVTHDQRGAAEPDWSPDGAAIAYESGPYPSGDGDVSNIFVVDLATGETSQVTHEKPTTETCLSCPQGAAYPQFAPTGTSIVYVRAVPVPHPADPLAVKARGSLRIVPVTGGKSVPLVGGFFGTVSPDGSTFAVECRGRLEGICIANADDTTARVLVSGPMLYAPKWSPDSTRIAYFNAEQPIGEYKIFVVDVATGETTFVAEGTAYEWLDDHTLIIENCCPG